MKINYIKPTKTEQYRLYNGRSYEHAYFFLDYSTGKLGVSCSTPDEYYMYKSVIGRYCFHPKIKLSELQKIAEELMPTFQILLDNSKIIDGENAAYYEINEETSDLEEYIEHYLDCKCYELGYSGPKH